MEKGTNVFRNRNFVLVFLGQAVSSIGALLYNFAAGFHILRLSDNNSVLQGVYLAVCGVIFCLFSPLGGVISDRVNRAKIMYLCDFLRGALILLITLPMILWPEDRTLAVIMLFVCGVIGNVIGAIFAPAGSSLLPFILPAERLQQANSYFSILNSVQSVVGIVLAGILYAALPVQVLYLVVGGCYLLSGLSETWIRYEYVPQKGGITLATIRKDFTDGLRYLWGNLALRSFLLIMLLTNFFFSPLTNNFLPYFIATDVAGRPYLLDHLLTPEMWMSVFSISLGAGSVLMGLFLSMRPRKERVSPGVKAAQSAVALVYVAIAVFYLLFHAEIISLNTVLIVTTAVAFFLGLLLVKINVPLNTLILTITDGDQLGKVHGVINVASQGLIPLASFLAGLAISAFGSGGLLVICAAGFLLTDILLLLNKHVNSL